MDEYIRKADAVDRMNRYGSIWMEYTEAMSKHEVAEQALKASKQAVIDVLKNMPSADVVQVVHSEWIYHMSYGVCKKCGYEYEWKGTDVKNYCPNCGAKMDREE